MQNNNNNNNNLSENLKKSNFKDLFMHKQGVLFHDTKYMYHLRNVMDVKFYLNYNVISQILSMCLDRGTFY